MNAHALTLAQNAGSLERYMFEVQKYPLLKREEETQLACQYYDHGDIQAAHKLVVSNLRFVVKLANEYRGYGLQLLDIIQEGNIGLMHAVKKFNPHKGYRLITYAVWWIRAYIQDYVLRAWSMVKLGTGRVAKRLFFKLRSAKSRLEQKADATNPIEDTATQLAKQLGVTEQDISDMELRLASKDYELDAPLRQSATLSRVEMLSAPESDPEDTVAFKEEKEQLHTALDQMRTSLSDKEERILDARLLTDEPKTLEELGSEFHVTRERARQIEAGLLKKLRSKLAA